MMKKYFLFSAIALALVSCSQTDEPGALNEPKAASFSAQIGKAVSRAAGTEWTAGDAIGISGVSGTKTYSNVEYTTASGDGNFAPVSDGIFYQTTDPVTFTAYYPYNAGGGVISASTADQTQQPSFDFLWAQASGSYADPEVSFNFAHRMAQLNISFTNGNDVDLSGLTFSLDGLVADGTFDTATGEAKVTEGGASASLTTAVNTESKASLIVFPQTADNLTLNVTVEGQQYQCDFSLGTLAAGHSYNVTLAVKKTGLTVTGCTITDWTDGGTFNGNATMPVPARKGDFFYSDGTYSTELDATKTCIGIVFWTPADVNPDPNALTPASLTDDKIMAAEHPECTHGLVVALQDAGEWVNWAEDDMDSNVYQDFQNTDNFTAANKENYRPVSSDCGKRDEINYILGYQNTKVLKAYNEWTDDSKKDVKLVESLAEFVTETPAPKNTTGWFIPSPKELTLLVDKDVDNIHYLRGMENKTFIEDKIILAGGSRLLSYLWSSTEYAGTYTHDCMAYTFNISTGYLHFDYKSENKYLRPVLAF